MVVVVVFFCFLFLRNEHYKSLKSSKKFILHDINPFKKMFH